MSSVPIHTTGSLHSLIFFIVSSSDSFVIGSCVRYVFGLFSSASTADDIGSLVSRITGIFYCSVFSRTLPKIYAELS